MKILNCIIYYIAVDGVWKEWSVWEDCNVTCGGGRQSRFRTCIQPQFGGLPCNGSDIETIDCNTQFCPGNVYHTTKFMSEFIIVFVWRYKHP